MAIRLVPALTGGVHVEMVANCIVVELKSKATRSLQPGEPGPRPVVRCFPIPF